MDIKKKLRLNKIANILIYFANNVERFGFTKANKLLYYTDCYHLLKYGRTVTEDVYTKLPQGPVPEDIYFRITSVDECRYYSNEEELKNNKNIEYLSNFIDVQMEYLGINPETNEGMNLKKIIAKKDFETKWLSESELEIIKEVAAKYKSTTATELSKKTHKEPLWQNAEMNDQLDLKLWVKDKVTPEQFEEICHIENTQTAININYRNLH